MMSTCSNFPTESITIVPSNEPFESISSGTDTQSCSSVSNRFIISSVEGKCPDGSNCWIPVVPDAYKPKIGAEFSSYNDCFYFYELYAAVSGFDAKKSSQNKGKGGIVTYKVFRCNREGCSDNATYDSLKVNPASKKVVNRKSASVKTGCGASIRCKLSDRKCVIFKVHEAHNHKLVSEENRNQLKKGRKLDFEDMNFFHDLSSRSNIGPMVAHRLKADLSGGLEFVGPQSIDYKNFKRDINRYIAETDAHIVIERLLRKKEDLVNFTCEYRCDVDGSLLGVFWSDNISKLNYKEFGDVISFDATYGTNRYNMVFVPITGIDNHRRCVVLGAALLSSETVESYSWFIDAFLKTFEKEPTLLVTDQDPAMLIAIRTKFKTAKHRLCIWHISTKLCPKVGHVLYNNKDFQKRMKFIFWNRDMTPESFEKRWSSLIDDFNLHDTRWFVDMYALKHIWIPCFFVDTPMNGLMRTSSLSESENSFFSKCKNKTSNLVDFFFRFEAAMDRQRHTHRLLEFEMENKRVNCVTRTKIERHAREIYTTTVFVLVQMEIEQSFHSCAQISRVIEGNNQICMIQEKFDPPRRTWNYKVVYDATSGIAECSCLMFTRLGLLCRHIFCLYNINDVHVIPDHYVSRRWSQEASESFNSLSDDVIFQTEYAKVTKHMFNKLRKVVVQFKNDKQKLLAFRDKFDLCMKEFDAGVPGEQASASRTDQIEDILGFSRPIDVTIHPPKNVRHKGQRGTKRSASAHENGVSKVVKTRECQYCYTSGHNIRSCSQRLVDEEEQRLKEVQEEQAKCRKMRG